MKSSDYHCLQDIRLRNYRYLTHCKPVTSLIKKLDEIGFNKPINEYSTLLRNGCSDGEELDFQLVGLGNIIMLLPNIEKCKNGFYSLKGSLLFL